MAVELNILLWIEIGKRPSLCRALGGAREEGVRDAEEGLQATTERVCTAEAWQDLVAMRLRAEEAEAALRSEQDAFQELRECLTNDLNRV